MNDSKTILWHCQICNKKTLRTLDDQHVGKCPECPTTIEPQDTRRSVLDWCYEDGARIGGTLIVAAIIATVLVAAVCACGLMIKATFF